MTTGAAAVLAGATPTTGTAPTAGQATTAPAGDQTQQQTQQGTGGTAATQQGQQTQQQATTEGVPDWAKGWKPEHQALLAKKKFTSPEQIAESYANLEKLQSGDKIAWPKDDADPARREAFVKMGALASAEEYVGAVQQLEGAPPIDKDFVGAMAQIAFGGNEPLTANQWRHLTNSYQKLTQDMVAAGGDPEAQFIETRDAEISALQTELGKNWNERVADGQRAVAVAGVDQETVEKIERAIGAAATIKMFMAFGSKFGKEIPFVDGANSPMGMTPEMAQAELNRLKADPIWSKALLGRGAKEMAEFERLTKIIAEGSSS